MNTACLQKARDISCGLAVMTGQNMTKQLVKEKFKQATHLTNEENVFVKLSTEEQFKLVACSSP